MTVNRTDVRREETAIPKDYSNADLSTACPHRLDYSDVEF
jgi:hypothetical protein